MLGAISIRWRTAIPSTDGRALGTPRLGCPTAQRSICAGEKKMENLAWEKRVIPVQSLRIQLKME
jgi:hypothetical protein